MTNLNVASRLRYSHFRVHYTRQLHLLLLPDDTRMASDRCPWSPKASHPGLCDSVDFFSHTCSLWRIVREFFKDRYPCYRPWHRLADTNWDLPYNGESSRDRHLCHCVGHRQLCDYLLDARHVQQLVIFHLLGLCSDKRYRWLVDLPISTGDWWEKLRRQSGVLQASRWS